MTPHSTFFAPGQRYVEAGVPDWRTDQQLTVVFVGPDLDGIPRVAVRHASGHDFVDTVARFETAVIAGCLQPVVGVGRITRW